jgi:hypothetical protein
MSAISSSALRYSKNAFDRIYLKSQKAEYECYRPARHHHIGPIDRLANIRSFIALATAHPKHTQTIIDATHKETAT